MQDERTTRMQAGRDTLYPSASCVEADRFTAERSMVKTTAVKKKAPVTGADFSKKDACAAAASKHTIAMNGCTIISALLLLFGASSGFTKLVAAPNETPMAATHDSTCTGITQFRPGETTVAPDFMFLPTPTTLTLVGVVLYMGTTGWVCGLCLDAGGAFLSDSTASRELADAHDVARLLSEPAAGLLG